ncbi:MAG TPA: biliverdin-producing heme oxygenase [Sphingobacteriaceae bacterium]
MLSAQLKAYTGKAHASLEKKIIQKLKTISSSGDYYRILSLFYGYYYELEKLITAYLDTDILPDYDQRRKSAAIVQDIESLFQSTDSLPVCTELPQISTGLQALGALYVLEGSTLGGQVISKMITDRIDLPGYGLSFFESYGTNTYQMWGLFVQKLNELQLNAEERQELLDAANNTFIKFENWVEHHDQ